MTGDGYDRGAAETWPVRVRPEWVDHYGHMNLAWYLAVFDMATDRIWPSLLLGRPFRARGLGTFAAESWVAYRREVMDGNLNLRLLASTIGKNETTLRGATPVDRAGDLGNSIAAITNGTPRWTGNFTVGYDRGPFSFFAQERYISKGYYDHSLLEGLPAGGRSSVSDNSVPSVFYTDMTVKYRFEVEDKRLEVYATVNNLFNKAPPVAPSVTTATYYPTNTFIYDMYGRYYVAGLRFQF